MKTLNNWNDIETRFAESKRGVLAFLDPFEGLLRGSIGVWPSSEIVQKLYKSRHQRVFRGENQTAVTEALGYYCDLQSIHSEDAITWSVFGPIAHAESARRREFCESLFALTDPSLPPPRDAHVSLWKRLPHPDSLVPGGPEIDFFIRSNDVVLLGEAKWLSSVGKAQGVNRDKDQITLRREIFEKYGQVFFPGTTHYVVLGASLGSPAVEREDIQLPNGKILLRDLPWDAICHIESHPLSDELSRYYEWKKANSKTK